MYIKITGILKDPKTEEIKATDSFSFYFNQGVGLGPKVSHTLSPDILTNRDVMITVKAEDMLKLGITDKGYRWSNEDSDSKQKIHLYDKL